MTAAVIRLLVLHYARPDLPAARSLFEAALGVEFTLQAHLSTLSNWATILPNDTVLELWPAAETRPVSRVQLEFGIPDLDAAAERLDAAGVEVRRLTGTALVLDPNGNTVALTVGRPTPRRQS